MKISRNANVGVIIFGIYIWLTIIGYLYISSYLKYFGINSLSLDYSLYSLLMFSSVVPSYLTNIVILGKESISIFTLYLIKSLLIWSVLQIISRVFPIKETYKKIVFEISQIFLLLPYVVVIFMFFKHEKMSYLAEIKYLSGLVSIVFLTFPLFMFIFPLTTFIKKKTRFNLIKIYYAIITLLLLVFSSYKASEWGYFDAHGLEQPTRLILTQLPVANQLCQVVNSDRKKVKYIFSNNGNHYLFDYEQGETIILNDNFVSKIILRCNSQNTVKRLKDTLTSDIYETFRLK